MKRFYCQTVKFMQFYELEMGIFAFRLIQRATRSMDLLLVDPLSTNLRKTIFYLQTVMPNTCSTCFENAAFYVFHCRSGSVAVDMTLVFTSKSSVPSASSATSSLSSELTSNSTSLDIISGSVSACKAIETEKP